MKLLIAFLTLFYVQNLNAEVLALKTAVDLALENNPSLRESAERVNQTKTGVPLAKSLVYPNVYGVVGVNQKKDSNNSASPTRTNVDSYSEYTAAVKLDQVLFKYGALSGVEAAQKDVRISELQTQITQRDLISSVIQAYFEIILTQRNVDALRTQEKFATEAVSFTNKRVRTGRSQSFDSLQAQTQLELLHGQLSTAENNLQIARSNLANLLGRKSSDDLSVAAPDVPDLTRFEKIVKGSKASIFEIEQSDLAIKEIDDRKNVLLGELYPTLDLVGSYNFLGPRFSSLTSADANSWSVGLQLTIPIFSGFSTVEKKRSLISQRLQLEFRKASVENQFSYLQSTNLKKLEIARNSISTGSEGLRLALKSSAEARRQYRYSTIDFLQYLNAQQAQSQAEQALNGYKFNYVTALTNYYVASGQSLNQLVEVLDKK